MIDARGYSCPTPVLMVQNAVKESAPASLEVLVDNRCAVENISRYGASQGYSVDCKEEGEDFRLSLKK